MSLRTESIGGPGICPCCGQTPLTGETCPNCDRGRDVMAVWRTLPWVRNFYEASGGWWIIDQERTTEA